MTDLSDHFPEGLPDFADLRDAVALTHSQEHLLWVYATRGLVVDYHPDLEPIRPPKVRGRTLRMLAREGLLTHVEDYRFGMPVRLTAAAERIVAGLIAADLPPRDPAERPAEFPEAPVRDPLQ